MNKMKITQQGADNLVRAIRRFAPKMRGQGCPRSVLMRALLAYATASACLAANPTFTIDAIHAAGKVSPKLYGLMTEEINHSYDGGLYAELIQNRAFLDNKTSPKHWSIVQGDGAAAKMALDPSTPLSDAIPASLRVDVTQASAGHEAGIANEG